MQVVRLLRCLWLLHVLWAACPAPAPPRDNTGGPNHQAASSPSSEPARPWQIGSSRIGLVPLSYMAARQCWLWPAAGPC